MFLFRWFYIDKQNLIWSSSSEQYTRYTYSKNKKPWFTKYFITRSSKIDSDWVFFVFTFVIQHKASSKTQIACQQQFKRTQHRRNNVSDRTNVSDWAEKLNVGKQAVAKKMNSTEKNTKRKREWKESSKNNNRPKWCNIGVFFTLSLFFSRVRTLVLSGFFYVIYCCQRERDQEFVI